MRWIIVTCILLTATANVLSRPHQKRDLTYIKNLIASKLFGTETIVIQQPEIPKNKTYQIFKIKGHDNILLKVIRKNEAEKEEQQEEHKKEKYQVPVIVRPDISIIGSYLGTGTEGETLLAMEIAKNLLKTGVLSGKRDKLIMDAVVPTIPKLPYNYYVTEKNVKQQNILTEERDPFYVRTPGNDQAEKIQVINRNHFPVFSEHPPIILASEVKYRPLQTKYSYEQKGETSDMLFESYNNQDVIVTRTSKVPSLPQFIKLRFAEVASIGSNPYLIRPQRPVEVVTEAMPGSYGYVNPSMLGYTLSAPIPWYVNERLATVPKPVSIGVVEEPGYVLANENNRPPIFVDKTPFIISEPSVPEFMSHSSMPFDIRNHLTEAEIDKINLYINGKLMDPTAKITANTDANSHIVTEYIYKEFNHNSRDNMTVVNVGDVSRLDKDNLTETNILESSIEVPKDYIFIPPENVDIPPPNMIPKTNQIRGNINGKKDLSQLDNNNAIDDKLDLAKEDVKTSQGEEYSFNNHPVVVFDDEVSDQKRVKSVYRVQPRKSYLVPFTGGPVF